MVRSKTIESERICFSSEDLPPSRRVAALQEFISRFDGAVEISPVGGIPLKAFAEYQRWSTVSLLFCQTTPVSITRTPAHTKDGNKNFRLFRVASGDFQVVSQFGTEKFDNNQAALLSNATPAKLVLDQGVSFASMRIPREALVTAARNLDGKAAHRVDASNMALRLLIGYQDFLRSQDAASDRSLAFKVAQHLIDLMALALTPVVTEHPCGASAVREARLEAIKSDILANLSQVRLSAKTVARRHGVTDRYIHKLFEETGETFGRYVMEERLKRAYKLLVAPPCTIQIGNIALEVGFGELSTFNRAFKRRFGDTPTTVRRKFGADGLANIGERALPRNRRDAKPPFWTDADLEKMARWNEEILAPVAELRD